MGHVKCTELQWKKKLSSWSSVVLGVFRSMLVFMIQLVWTSRSWPCGLDQHGHFFSTSKHVIFMLPHLGYVKYTSCENKKKVTLPVFCSLGSLQTRLSTVSKADPTKTFQYTSVTRLSIVKHINTNPLLSFSNFATKACQYKSPESLTS